MSWETKTSGAHADWRRRVSQESAGARVFAVEPDLDCDFSIVVVNYNVREFLRQMLLSLRQALRQVRAEIFVVDNASDDGSVEMAQSQFPECTVLANEENLGFAAANNLALKRTHGRYLVLLNPDTVVQEDTFTLLRDFMDRHPRTGMAGCKVLNPDGTLQLACRRSFPTPWVAFTKLSGLSLLFPRSRWFGRYNLTFLPEDETCEVEAISGSFMVVRREAVAQVGLLDEDFFMYGEDLDWCYRIRSAGWQIHYFPGTQIVHFKGESSRRSSFDSLRLFYQSMGLFVQKHFRRRMFVLSYWILHLAIWMRAVMAFAKTLLSALAIPFVDLSLMQLGLGIAIWLRFESTAVWPKYLIIDAVYSAVWLVCLAVFGCHGRARFSAYQALLATMTGFLINASFTFFFKQYAFSRQVVLIAGVLTVFVLTAWRLAVKALYYLGVGKFSQVASHTVRGLRTLVVGDFSTDSSLVESLKMNMQGNYELVGLISLEAAQVGQAHAGVPVIATLDELDELLLSPTRHRIEQVIFSTQRVTYDRIIGAMSRQRKQGISFKLVPSQLDVIIGKSSIDAIVEVPLVEIKNRLNLFWPRLGKRAFDAGLAAVALIVFFPSFIWHWLKARQFENFEVAGTQPRMRLRYLPQAGRAGKWLWFWWILAGRLSWVGRELTAEPTEQSRSQQIGLPPGITGLAQVHHRRVLSEEEKDKYYLYYVTHYSPLLDVEILFRATFRI
jgi:GT2 family glycosyltransferase/lipopolysaccharide/colanic/teichoic acid biosynthesis glycosyltransferase